MGDRGREIGVGGWGLGVGAPESDEAAVEPESDEAAGGEAAGPLTPEEVAGELGRTRTQAARYRVQRNEVRQQLVTVQGALDVAQARVVELEQGVAAAAPDPVRVANARADRLAAAMRAGVSLEGLDVLDALQAAPDAEALRTALETARRIFGNTTDGGNPVPPAQPTTAPTLDEQIAVATAAGKFDLVLQLKAQKALAARRG